MGVSMASTRRGFLKFLGMAPVAVVAAPALATAALTAPTAGLFPPSAPVTGSGWPTVQGVSGGVSALDSSGLQTVGYLNVVKTAEQLAADRVVIQKQIEAFNVSQGRRPDGYEWFPDGWGMVN